MGTSYSPLKKHYKSIDIQSISPTIDRIVVGIDDTIPNNCLTIVCDSEISNDLFWSFVDEDVNALVIYFVYGKVSVQDNMGLPDSTVVISEYRDITTVGEVKAKVGGLR